MYLMFVATVAHPHYELRIIIVVIVVVVFVAQGTMAYQQLFTDNIQRVEFSMLSILYNTGLEMSRQYTGDGYSHLHR